MTIRSLLVGVPNTRVRFGRGLKALPGTVADVDTMTSLLSDRDVPNLTTLVGGDATLNAVQEALCHLAAATRSGDLSIFYFAGHGVGLVDYSGDDEDHSDEALVCEDDFLVDDWFAAVFWPSVQPGSSWVMVVDACASASSVRSIVKGSIEIYPRPATIGMLPRPSPETTPNPSAADHLEGAKQVHATPQVELPPAPVEPFGVVTLLAPGESAPTPRRARIVFSACSDNASATELPATAGVRARGLYTTKLTEALRQNPGLTYGQLAEVVHDAVVAYPVGLGFAAEPVCYYDSPDGALLGRVALSGDPRP